MPPLAVWLLGFRAVTLVRLAYDSIIGDRGGHCRAGWVWCYSHVVRQSSITVAWWFRLVSYTTGVGHVASRGGLSDSPQ